MLNQEAHLLKVDGLTILIDAGGGNGKVRRPGGVFHLADRPFLEQFARAGVGLDEIDVVVFTHLHVDHVGFATSLAEDGSWQPTFPRARYLVVREELDWWTRSRRPRRTSSGRATTSPTASSRCATRASWSSSRPTTS